MTQGNADTLKRSLRTRVLGQVVHYWDEVDSTNAALARLSKDGASEGTVVTQDEAFSLALQIEQSELNTIYHDLVLMGRAAVKLMARHMDESLSLPKYQQGLLAGAKRFLPSGEVRRRAQA